MTFEQAMAMARHRGAPFRLLLAKVLAPHIGAAAASHAHAAADVTSGTFDNARINFAAPAAIGNTTPAAGTFTTLTASGDTTFGSGIFTVTGSSQIRLSSGNGNVILRRGDGVTFLTANYNTFFDCQAREFRLGHGGTGGPVSLFLGGDGILEQRNATNAQTFNLYNTFTSATNHERGFLKWSSNVFQIGTEKGSGGGTARNLHFQTDGSTRLYITTGGNIIIGNGDGTTQASSALVWQGNARINATNTLTGVITLGNRDNDGFNRLQFGGTTSSFPALKRSSTVLQSRLADDSDFAPLQGQLRTHANAVTETITADKTLTLYDAAGTAYKVPCVAA